MGAGLFMYLRKPDSITPKRHSYPQVARKNPGLLIIPNRSPAKKSGAICQSQAQPTATSSPHPAGMTRSMPPPRRQNFRLECVTPCIRNPNQYL